jgi:4-amino-4-deoxy-L-arabinose transferase-like glycosyltransferase
VSRRRLLGLTLLVFAGSFVLLAWNVKANGIAAAYTDPVDHVRAQDEALYVNASIRITQDHDWLTPKFLGRPFFLKPPLLMWLSAASIRTFGLSLFAVRFPALLLGAAGVAAVFFWLALWRSVWAALAGAVLLTLSPIWQVFSRLCFTDILAASFATLALVAVAADPRIELRRTAVLFGVFSGAAILSKSVAGLLPGIAFVLYLLVSSTRPKLGRLVEMVGWAAIVAGPWHVYQLVIHRQYFWAEYVQFQLLGVGLKGMATGDFNHSPVFYLARLVRLDPVLALFGFGGLAVSLRELRDRKPNPRLLALCWILIVGAALCAFQAKNLPYLVFLLPGLCIVAMGAWDKAFFAVAIIALAVVGRLAIPSPVVPPIEGAVAIRAYFDMQRAAELIVAQPDDEFYSATIPLPHVRYAVVDPSRVALRMLPYYGPLGVILTAEEFLALPDGLTKYQQKSGEWGLGSTEAVGSTILLNEPGDLLKIAKAHPETDFYVPADWVAGVDAKDLSHQTFRYSAARVLLLNRAALKRSTGFSIPSPW